MWAVKKFCPMSELAVASELSDLEFTAHLHRANFFTSYNSPRIDVESFKTTVSQFFSTACVSFKNLISAYKCFDVQRENPKIDHPTVPA
jgi:hypothetical protein